MNESPSNAEPSSPRDSAVLEFSANPELWTIARLVVSSVASRLDFPLDALDDLRFSVDELCTLCATGAGTADRISLTVSWGVADVEVDCQVRVTSMNGAVGHAAVEPGLSDPELSKRILAALVDDYEITPGEDGLCRGWFRKVRATSQIP